MYTITLETGFFASHGLKYAGGKAEPVHPHQWVVRAAVESEKLDENGIAVDFVLVKEKLDELTKQLEGEQLENLEYFSRINASAENVAKYLYEHLERQIPEPAKLESIEVMEAPGCWAKYTIV